MRTVAATLPLMLLAACLAQAQPVSDDKIYDDVRLRLAGDRDVKGGALEVIVTQGVVTLRGKVRSEKVKQKAARIARKVKGVKKVVNELEIELPGAKNGTAGSHAGAPTPRGMERWGGLIVRGRLLADQRRG